MPYPLEVPFSQVKAELDHFVDEVFGVLESAFLTLPRGEGFIEYGVFEQGYEALKRATGGFQEMPSDVVIDTVFQVPISFIVLRTMLGFTPPEWAYVTAQRTGIEVGQGAIRTIDRRIRMAPLAPLRVNGGVTEKRLRALVSAGVPTLVRRRAGRGTRRDSPTQQSRY